MERKAYKQLLEWKNNPRHKPLIVNGARQVGKTWLLKYFWRKRVQEYCIHKLRQVNPDEGTGVHLSFHTVL